MIIVRLKGGLGNQMFQYALGRCLAEKHHTVLKLDITFLLNRLPRKNFVFRDYDLDIFNIEESFTWPSKFAVIFNNIAFPLYYFYLKIRQFFDRHYVIREKKDYVFDQSILDLPDDVYLDGYWQNEKYFKDIKDIIKKDFTFKKDLDENGTLMAEKIKNSNAVCVNVRRADYINNPLNRDFFGTMDSAYYKQAEKIISSKIEHPHFFVFSDDIEWCKNNLNFDHPVTFIGREYAGKKWQQYLQLMIMCEHFIIPNSTFAWWAAWLNKSQNKIVIAPKKWVANPNINKNTQDLIPPSWIRV